MSDDTIHDSSTGRVSLREGGLYYIFSGDPATPYMVAEVLKIQGNSITIKIYCTQHANPPVLDTTDEFGTTEISTEMFYAWGPPKFPILLNY